MTGPTTPAIDGPALLAMVDGDRDLIAQLFDLFLGDAPGRVARMHAAIAAADTTILGSEAHSIKGSAANLRVTGIAHEALQIEVAAHNDDFAAAATALARVEALLAMMPAAIADVMKVS